MEVEQDTLPVDEAGVRSLVPLGAGSSGAATTEPPPRTLHLPRQRLASSSDFLSPLPFSLPVIVHNMGLKSECRREE